MDLRAAAGALLLLAAPAGAQELTGQRRLDAIHTRAPTPRAPPPTLALSFAPPMPAIPDKSPVGTFVTRVVPVWSDGLPFTGTLKWALPYRNAGGCFAFAGKDILVSCLLPKGPTVLNATVKAVQNR